jgi:LIVCS family branched-chain amino acid:cation transporter
MEPKNFFTKKAFFVGIAIFTMVFGAGNIVFPIAIGNFTGNNYPAAFLGILLSSVLIPLAGFLACLRYHGSYERFLTNWIGRIPTILITILAMLILGPLGCIPRCATLAHAAVSWNLTPEVSLFLFGLCFFSVVLLLSMQQKFLITIFGKLLGPINLGFMAILVIKGIFIAPETCACIVSATESFSTGFLESYKTFDLLAMIFYSNAIVSAVAAFAKAEDDKPQSQDLLQLCQAGAIVAATIFAAVYFAFCFIAAKNAHLIPLVEKKDLVNAYSTAILGSKLGVLAGLIVLLACLNSACALSVVFARYLSGVGHRFGIGYPQALFACTIFSLGFSNFGFSGVDNALTPITQLVYPILILISILGLLHALFFKQNSTIMAE